MFARLPMRGTRSEQSNTGTYIEGVGVAPLGWLYGLHIILRVCAQQSSCKTEPAGTNIQERALPRGIFITTQHGGYIYCMYATFYGGARSLRVKLR